MFTNFLLASSSFLLTHTRYREFSILCICELFSVKEIQISKKTVSIFFFLNISFHFSLLIFGLSFHKLINILFSFYFIFKLIVSEFSIFIHIVFFFSFSFYWKTDSFFLLNYCFSSFSWGFTSRFSTIFKTFM